MIPDRFSYAVKEHVVLSLAEIEVHPVILGIFGTPGEGKTFQLRKLLDSFGVETLSINAAELESDRAGTPGKMLLENYTNAARAIERGRPTAIAIDDIDTTVGEWEQNTGTVNHQQLLAQLMHLADHPCYVERIGRISRVPMFITGNDFGKLYPPLKRPGRLVPFHWHPSASERLDIAAAILDGLVDRSQVAQLVSLYVHRPIAFFTEIRSHILREGARESIEKLARNLATLAGQADLYRSHIIRAAGTCPHTRVAAIAAELDARHLAMSQSYVDTQVYAHGPEIGSAS